MCAEMVTVARFSLPMEAEMARLRLESEGIESVISGSAITNEWATIQGISLRVREEDAERAGLILAE